VKPAQNPLKEMFQSTERFGHVGKKMQANHKAIGSGQGIEFTEGKGPGQLRETNSGHPGIAKSTGGPTVARWRDP